MNITKLIEMRKHAKIRQEDVATALNISRTAVSKWESGVAYPHPSKIPKLAKLYGVSADAILTACKLAQDAKGNEPLN